MSAYRLRLHQLFSNLLSNSLKYKGEHDTIIEITAEKSPSCVTVAFKDNGQGIPEDMREHIFKDFKRLHANEEIEGTGLGLSICKKIVQLHGGKIWVESEGDEGTTFYFTLRPV